MTKSSNVEVIVDRMIDYMINISDNHYKTEIASRCVELAEQFAPSNQWLIQTMNKVFEHAGDLVNIKVAHNLMRLIAEGFGEDHEDADSQLRSSAVESYLRIMAELKLPSAFLQVICWVLGEYGTADGKYTASCITWKLCDVAEAHSTDDTVKEDLQRYQPHNLISVPLVYETLHSGNYRQISASSSVRKIIAFSFVRISLMYMDFRRIFEGKVLPMLQNRQFSSVPPLLVWLWAGVMTALFWPLHMLGVKLVYSKIHASLGISKAGISGGGSLPLHIDNFFEAIGIRLQNGYGLTETSPVVAARRLEYNVLGTVGHPLRSTEIKIVDLETGSDLPAGRKGIVKVRGPQVMKGYYKNEDATTKVLDKEGWLDTGDIGWIVPSSSTGPSRNCGGMLVLEGRSKDTIVLSTGENVEPSEIEEAAIRSNLIQQIIVLGQDQRRLGALIVPSKEELLLAARKLSQTDELDGDSESKIFSKLIRDELTFWTSECSFQIGPFLLLDEPFTLDNGLLTPTMKIRRDQVVARYSSEIAKLFI